jgi:dTDP-4-amino-4,6-dideoxygalactose transaminase
MSATCAAPMFTGATPFFVDVEDETFGIVHGPIPDTTKAIFSTNLFGHPSPLGRNEWDKNCGTYLIEDNSQSPFAWAHDRYAGTMGHIGVFSLNVHKPLQCGEGGIVVTDDDDLAARMRAFINHGEHVSDRIGLNLRMPEVCAAIAMVQLRRGEQIVQSRIDQATAILAAIGNIPGLRMPIVRKGCRHVYYTIPFLLDMRTGTADSDVNAIYLQANRRAKFCAALRAEGVPIIEGYVPPLYQMPAFAKFARPCPVAEDLHDRRLFYFENCAHDVTLAQAEEIGDAFRKAAEQVL